MNSRQDAYIGTSGWESPRWRGDLYETGLRQRDELAYLSLPMNSADIAGSFCSLQKPERSARWRDETHPPGAGRHCRPLSRAHRHFQYLLLHRLHFGWTTSPPRHASTSTRMPTGQRHGMRWRWPQFWGSARTVRSQSCTTGMSTRW